MSIGKRRIVRGRRLGMRAVRSLLAKAEGGELLPVEQILLRGEFARLDARIASINARMGRTVVEVGPCAGALDEAGAAAAAV